MPPSVRRNLFGEPVRGGRVLGCGTCPLDRAPGIFKIKGLDRIRRQRAFLWAMCPGERENARRLELVGPSGQLLWTALKPMGLSREDFAIQNVVRCRPTDDNGMNRDPSKRELECCSVYNDEAIARNAGTAGVHVILGDVAGAQLLKKDFCKDPPIYWYDPWNAYVVINYHPSYLLHKGGERAGGEYYTWRDRFRAVRAMLDFPGRWGYVKSRGYRAVRTMSEFDAMEAELRSEANNGRRVSVDVETGEWEGREVMLMAGFGTGHYNAKDDYNSVDWKRWKGECYCVVLEHPESRYQPAHLLAMKARVARLVEDGTIRKALQHGSYDKDSFQKHLNARLRGYDYDTQYGTFIRYSFLRSCSLENLTYRFFPEFADYKDTVAEWMGNFARAPLDRLILRNGGDCDITKRLEERFSPQVRQPLVEVYIHAGITLDQMEERGPLLDRKSWEKAMAEVPVMIRELDQELKHVSGDPDFDCDSPPQVAWLVYDVLGMPDIGAGRSTKKEVLELLAAQTGNPVLDRISRRRALGKVKSTYLDGYAKSADLHDGELRTIWWLTGAVTGRLRSGRGEKAEAEGVVNFQNLHGNPLLQNLLVSDENWRRAL